MGQAKKRGTFEERLHGAELRNRLVKKLINETENKQLQKLVASHGIQRVAVSLVQTRQLQDLQTCAKSKQNEAQPPLLVGEAKASGQQRRDRDPAHGKALGTSLVARPGGLFVPRK